MVRFWRWGKLRDGKKGRISRVLPVGRGVYWGFWEASQKLPAKREFLGTSVEEKRLPVMRGFVWWWGGVDRRLRAYSPSLHLCSSFFPD